MKSHQKGSLLSSLNEIYVRNILRLSVLFAAPSESFKNSKSWISYDPTAGDAVYIAHKQSNEGIIQMCAKA